MKRTIELDPPAPATDAGPEPGPTPEAARAVFAQRLPRAERYAVRLASDGVLRGLIGPREVPRLWDRHLLNCAVLTDLLPLGVRVVDVGSGAGLPGIPMAIRRPDLRVDLLEPMLRRAGFLTEVVADLGLTDHVRVVRGRAEQPEVRRDVGEAHWVVARAVAPLDRLVKWCLPLLAVGGRLLAMKGSTAQAEVEEYGQVIRRMGAGEIDVRMIGGGAVQPTWVVSVQRVAGPRPSLGRRTKR